MLEWQGCQPLFGPSQFKFKLEHAPKAAAMMRPGDYMFTVDMKSGYHQIALKPSFQRFCCFQWKDRVYRWRVLPFGLSSAPRAYTKLSRCMLAFWRAKGIRVSNYIDDFIFFASSYEAALKLRDQVLLDMARFGWHISLSKSHLHPAQRVLYLGFEFCSVPVCHVMVPSSKVQALLGLLTRAISRHEAGKCLRGMDIAKIAGTLQSMRFAVSPVGLFTRAMYRWLAALPRDERDRLVFSVHAGCSHCIGAGVLAQSAGSLEWSHYQARHIFQDTVHRCQCCRMGWLGSQSAFQARGACYFEGFKPVGRIGLC